jgi:fucose permease
MATLTQDQKTQIEEISNNVVATVMAMDSPFIAAQALALSMAVVIFFSENPNIKTMDDLEDACAEWGRTVAHFYRNMRIDDPKKNIN